VFHSDSYLTPSSCSSPLHTYMAIRESSWFILAKEITGRVPVSDIQFPTVNQALQLQSGTERWISCNTLRVPRSEYFNRNDTEYVTKRPS